jgi:hypothetical protein
MFEVQNSTLRCKVQCAMHLLRAQQRHKIGKTLSNRSGRDSGSEWRNNLLFVLNWRNCIFLNTTQKSDWGNIFYKVKVGEILFVIVLENNSGSSKLILVAYLYLMMLLLSRSSWGSWACSSKSRPSKASFHDLSL